MIAYRHSHNATRPTVLDCTSIVQRDSVTAPYQSLSLTVKSGTPPVQIADWIVLRVSESLPACALGYVVGVDNAQSVSMSGQVNAQTWSVSCVGWFDLLARADFQVAYGLGDEGISTIFSPSELQAIAQAVGSPKDGNALAMVQRAFNDLPTLLSALQGFRGPGVGLQMLLTLGARIALPDSLGGRSIGQSVAVAYNDDTLSALAGPGLYERKGTAAPIMDPVPGRFLPNMSPLRASTKMLSTIQGMFGGDSNLIEMFPSLEDPGAPQSPIRAAASATDLGDVAPSTAGLDFRRSAGDASGVLTQTPASGLTSQGSPEPSDAARQLLPGLGEAIGRNPVVLYRLRPWRTQPLADWTRGAEAADRRLARVRRRVSDYIQETHLWSRVTWDASRAVRLTAKDDAIRLRQAKADDDVPNVFSTEWPGTGSPAAFMREAGLPLVFTGAERMGARLYTASWPFIRDEGKRLQEDSATDAGTYQPGSIANEAVTVAAQAAQFMGFRGLDMYRGAVDCRFRPDVRPGQIVTLSWPDGRQLTCYAESVDHTHAFQGNTPTSRTSIMFSRGLWDESRRYIQLPDPARAEDRRGRQELDLDGATVSDPQFRVDDGVTPLREMMPPTGLEK